MSGMRKAGDIVTDLFRDRFGPEFMETARSTAGLFNSWAALVTEAWPRSFDGEQNRAGPGDIPAAAVHSRIRELERGVLLIEADHPGWIQILQTKQAELLAGVQRRYPDLNIRAIAFRLSRDSIASDSVAHDPVTRDSIARDSITSDPGAAPAAPVSPNKEASADAEFYSALKGLEESIRKRNSP